MGCEVVGRELKALNGFPVHFGRENHHHYASLPCPGKIKMFYFSLRCELDVMVDVGQHPLKPSQQVPWKGNHLHISSRKEW